jgi:hypothetical protein
MQETTLAELEQVLQMLVLWLLFNAVRNRAGLASFFYNF